MLGKLLFLFFSLSFRSANLPDLPHDYEGKFGFETEQSNFSILKERENGMEYLGLDCRYRFERKILFVGGTGYLFDWEAEWYVKEAKEIDTQTIRVTSPLKDFNMNVGLALNSNYWQDSKLLLSFLYEIGSLEYSLETNFNDRIVQSLKLSNKFSISEKEDYDFYVEPLFLYKLVDDSTFWQMKLSVGIKLK